MNAVVANPSDAFRFDYLLYVPSPTAPMTGIVQVDNTDPAIQYSGGWSNFSDFANMTQTDGASMVFEFIGVPAFYFIGRRPHVHAFR